MTPEQQELIRYRLSRARQALTAAEVLLDKEDPFGATNRMYYSCFYAATALLASEGLTSNKHSGVLSLFDQHWVKPGRLPRTMSQFYHVLFDRRLKGDYDDFVSFEPQQVAAWLAQAREFVKTIAGLLPDEG